MMAKIFIVEDEPTIAELLSDYLVQANYETSLIDDGLQVIDKVKELEPDLILLDIMLPGKDGMTICREIREFSEIPIIMLTARVEEVDRLLGLEFGADDYICKPFSPREVVARIKAVLRRFNKEPLQDAHVIKLISESNKLKIGENEIELTVVEYKLFEQLYSSPGRIYSRNQLMDQIYSDHRVVGDRTIDSHIKKLRKKIDVVLPDVELIHSIYGAGYKYEQLE
ncbi:MAG: response regulator [Proteobacteria bacterium]|nr:response regulator [Pseudomonadota bacterium]NOG59009.1 response regulator [Pseudomonadota bacterium]